MDDDKMEDHEGCGICPGCDQCPCLKCPHRTKWMDFNAIDIDLGNQVILRNTMDCPVISLILVDGILQWDWDGVFYD